MRGRHREPPKYRPRIPEPLGIITTAERLAVVEGMGAVRRELTADESKCCLAVAALFSPQIASLEARVAELQADVIVLRRMVG